MIQDFLKAGYPVLLGRTPEPERFIGSAIKSANGRTAYQPHPTGTEPLKICPLT